MQLRDLPVVVRAWWLVARLDLPLMLIGGLAAALKHRWGAYVLIGNFALNVAFHQLVGAWAYRDVMRRPWPQVSASTDDDWDD